MALFAGERPCSNLKLMPSRSSISISSCERLRQAAGKRHGDQLKIAFTGVQRPLTSVKIHSLLLVRLDTHDHASCDTVSTSRACNAYSDMPHLLGVCLGFGRLQDNGDEVQQGVMSGAGVGLGLLPELLQLLLVLRGAADRHVLQHWLGLASSHTM